MIVFVAVVTVLIVAAIGFVAMPLLGPKGSPVTPAAWAALGCAGILLFGSTLLYGILSSRSWSRSAAAGSPAPRLASRADVPLIQVDVTLAPTFRDRAPHAASLYVFARDPAHGEQPLAVKRLPSRFPQTVELTSADAMIPGHEILAGERVQVVARISPSGDPMDEAGDLSGQVSYRIGHDGVVDLVIDHLTP